MQEKGIHYYESFSPTISQETLCIVMVLTMETIPGFSLSKDKSQCLRLLHTLYGLRDLFPSISSVRRFTLVLTIDK